MGGTFGRKRVYGAVGTIGVAAILVMTAVPAGAAVVLTSNFSGYGASPGSASTTTASYTVPKVVCHAGENSGVDAQVQLYGTTKAESAGAGVRLKCVKGVQTYQATYLLGGVLTFPALTVRAGDKIKETVAQAAPKTTLTIDDLSTHKTVTKTGPGASDMFASVGVNSIPVSTTNSTMQNVPDFGTLSFSAALVNGAKIGTFGPTQWERADASHHVEITTSVISGGSNFTTTFKRST